MCGEEIFRDIYKKYETRLKENRLIDFDDMLSYTYELLRKDLIYWHCGRTSINTY